MQEVSAFDEEGQEELEQQAREELPEHVRQMQHLQIDFKAVRLYFKLLKASFKHDTDAYKKSVSEMVELILHEWTVHQHGSSPELKLMCARGLLMLLHIEELGEFDWFSISHEIMVAVLEVYAKAESLEMRQETDLAKQDLLVQYISSFSSEQLHEYVMQLQSSVTINIITGVVNMDLLRVAVKILDILFWVN